MAKKQDDYATLVRHARRMLRSRDGFQILVRGMVLIDEALEYVIDAYSAIGWRKLDQAVRQMSLAEKAHIACALGCISQGELRCILEINTLRNKVAHQMDIEVSQRQEADIVRTFGAQTKLFQGLNYDPTGYPGTLAFLLFTFPNSLRMRTSRPDVRLSHLEDKTNTEHMAAVVLTNTLREILNRGVEDDDEKVLAALKYYTDEAKRHREEDAAL